MNDGNEVKLGSLAQGLNAHNHTVTREPFSKLSTISEASDIISQKSFVTSDPAGIPNNAFTDNSGESHLSSNNNHDSSTEEPEGIDIDQELPVFNWLEFENQFTEALQLLDKEESQILDEFDHLMEMFFIWAQTGSSHETERSVKRLKTRERFVQLSEASFEKKKAHYIQVVSAFKMALDLLRK